MSRKIISELSAVEPLEDAFAEVFNRIGGSIEDMEVFVGYFRTELGDTIEVLVKAKIIKNGKAKK